MYSEFTEMIWKNSFHELVQFFTREKLRLFC